MTSITETIGDTPIVRLKKIAKEKGVKANLLAKLEFFNPIASVKDRIGVHMISVMEAPARSLPAKPPSSSQRPATPASRSPSSRRRAATSSSWSMPESMSVERRKMLALLGAELVLTPAPQGMKGSIAKAQELAEATPGAVIPKQFENPANVEIHRLTTAEEIWNDTKGEIDVFVSAVGTGGTITGVAQVLKPRRPSS